MAGRAHIRRALAEICGVPAAAIQFVVGPQGKPALVGHPGVDFNLSHSEGWAILATSDGIPVGIDIEGEREAISDSGIAHNFFAPP